MSTAPVSEDLLERKAALDLGSGNWKLLIADVSKGRIVRTIVSEERPLPFGASLVEAGPSRLLSESIQQQGLELLSEFCGLIKEHEVKRTCGVATEVFRRAVNGSEFLNRVQETLGLTVKLISQDEEARLSFISVLLMVGDADGLGNACVWDSGSGSFQISQQSPSRAGAVGSLIDDLDSIYLDKYMGSFGSSVAVGIYLKDVLQRQDLSATNVNPVSPEGASQLVEIIYSRLPPVPEWMAAVDTASASGSLNSMFQLCVDVLSIDLPQPVTEFTLAEAETALYRCTDRSDEELRDLYQRFPNPSSPASIVPKLCLLLAVMRRTRLRKVKVVRCVGACPAIIYDPIYWK